MPPTEAEDVPLEACRLADTLDEIIITIGSQIEGILKHLPDDRKAVSLLLLLYLTIIRRVLIISDLVVVVTCFYQLNSSSRIKRQ